MSGESLNGVRVPVILHEIGHAMGLTHDESMHSPTRYKSIMTKKIGTSSYAPDLVEYMDNLTIVNMY